jgi:hypothetical protein
MFTLIFSPILQDQKSHLQVQATSLTRRMQFSWQAGRYARSSELVSDPSQPQLPCAAILLCTSSSGRPPDPAHSPPCHFPQEQQPHYAYGYGYALQPQPAEDGLLEEDDACIRH